MLNQKYPSAFKTFLLLVFVCCCTVSFAQDHSFAPTRLPMTSNDNGIQAEINELENARRLRTGDVHDVLMDHTKNLHGAGKTTTGLPDTTCVVTIPVVFHVFHPNGSAGVPLSQVTSAMDDLNITFAGADADYLSVDPLFAAVKSYTKIRFRLAAIDPKGNPTTGVIYYKDKQSGLGNGTGWDREIKTMAWDNYKYLNVYVMNDLYANNVTNNSGVAWYPFTSMSDSSTARIVYNYWYLGTGGASFNNHEFNETFTHECGHYLNLYHTFDGASCTGPGDYCADTPPTDIAAAGCSASRCGGPINGENYMDYNATCYKNFTMDQNTRMEAALTDPARITLWQYDNLVATGIISPTTTNACVNATKFFSFSKTHLVESITNDGSIETPPVKIFACGGASFATPGVTLIAGIDYTVTGLPAGLTASVVTSSDAKSATLTFGGNAAAHASSNSVANVAFTFKNPAVSGGGVSAIKNYIDTFKIDFLDPWAKTCVTVASVTATPSAPWTRFETAGPIPRYYGVWYDTGNLFLENYGRGIITQSLTSDNVVFLTAGTTIGPASAWRAGGNQGLLYSPTYTTLLGQTGYVGFRMQAQNDFYYGWMKIQVKDTIVTLLEYQYNNKPNATIVVGAACSTVGVDDIVEVAAPLVYPNPTSGKIFIGQQSSGINGQRYELYFIDGRRVLQGEITSSRQEVDCTALAPGVYVLRIMNERRQITSVQRVSIIR